MKVGYNPQTKTAQKVSVTAGRLPLLFVHSLYKMNKGGRTQEECLNCGKPDAPTFFLALSRSLWHTLCRESGHCESAHVWRSERL